MLSKAITIWMSEAQFAALRREAELQGTGITKLCEDRLFVRNKEYRDDSQEECVQNSPIGQQDDEGCAGSNDQVRGTVISSETTGDAE